MKLHYDADTDLLHIELKETPGNETRKIVGGLRVDLDAKGEVVGIDIDGASRRFDLSTLETVAPPLSNAQRQELQARLAHHRAHPDEPARSLDEIRRKLALG